ncbi:MAG: VOC family protein [Thermomicrobiales bacterium]
MTVQVQLSMVGLMVEDMPRALAFYRLLGLEIPAEDDAKPFVMHRMPSGVTLFWDTIFAARYDPARTPVQGGYQSMLEFYLVTDDAVDAMFVTLTQAGYHGRMTPAQTTGPYAAMVDDPDGNVILLTSDQGSLASPDAGSE